MVVTRQSETSVPSDLAEVASKPSADADDLRWTRRVCLCYSRERDSTDQARFNLKSRRAANESSGLQRCRARPGHPASELGRTGIPAKAVYRVKGLTQRVLPSLKSAMAARALLGRERPATGNGVRACTGRRGGAARKCKGSLSQRGGRSAAVDPFVERTGSIDGPRLGGVLRFHPLFGHSSKSRSPETKQVFDDLWNVFWQACKETPRGMLLPFRAFWQVATHNPVLEKKSKTVSVVAMTSKDVARNVRDGGASGLRSRKARGST